MKNFKINTMILTNAKIAKIVENNNVILKKFGPNSIFESPYYSKFVFKDSSIQISISSLYTLFVAASKISILSNSSLISLS